MCSEGLVAHESTVLVAVRSARVREALVAVIGAMEGFRVVGEATTAEQALQLARAERPMLALVDDDLADCSGTWTMQELSGEVVVVAVGWRANAASQCRAAGARLYIEMGGSPEDVLSALLDLCPGRGPTGRAGTGHGARGHIHTDSKRALHASPGPRDPSPVPPHEAS